MAYPIQNKDTVIGIEEESTEGTFIAPDDAASYVQTLDGYSWNPTRELLTRGIVKSGLGPVSPKMGIKGVSCALPVELRGSGTEGGSPEAHSLLKSALGATRSIASAVTTKSSGSTSTELQIEDADISDFAVGDIVLVKEAGAFEMRPVTAVDSTGGAANITLGFALDDGAPSGSVVVSPVTMYYTAQSGHVPLSLSYYLGNQMRAAAIGCKIATMALENFSAGQLPSLNFSLEGLNHTYVDGAAPHTPAYDSMTPPVVLSACIFKDGVKINVNNLSLSLSNTISFQPTTCSANGNTKSVITQREITGSFDPYTDDTSTDNFDDWSAGTEFSMFVYAFNPSATAGEIALGSAVGIWLPQCVKTDYQPSNSDGVFVDQVSFQATRGAAGGSEEMYMGFV